MQCADQRVRLLIEGTEIPTVNEGVTTEISNDAQQSGADITRLTEAYIPIEWKDENITSKIQSFDPSSQGSYDRATVIFQNVRNGNWTRVHRGFIRGVSGSSDMGVAKVIINDPAALMSAVPFSKRYKEATVDEVFNDVATTFTENTPFTANVTGVPGRDVGGGGANDAGEGQEFVADSSYGVGTASPVNPNVKDNKAFKSNRHSCADALNWITEVTGGKWYFLFREVGGGLKLVYDDGSSAITFTQRQSHGAPQEQRLNNQGSLPNSSPSELDIITNDALAELFPINTLTVKGATGVSIFGFETSMLPSEKSPYVTVQYPPLVERAGGNVVSDTIETDNVTLDSATNTAKKKLEQRILDSGTGRIECYGNPNPKPYDTVIAQPECEDVLTTSVDPLPYTVASVRHQKKASSEMITFIEMSPKVDISEMTIVEQEMREV